MEAPSGKTYKHIFMSVFSPAQSQMSLAGNKMAQPCPAPTLLSAGEGGDDVRKT
jgi:hypothetical protein